ncbi:hypothetical protein LTR36_010132 [Oleoguttula mirabilis]|uniref:NACHT-NTPase and P-loop NTPases N-terminal domain-containing protein n=1 Tax=Oleoguttula mirabilis TaxID=1507867 RepID=A0AAV9JRV5_9PEZI|nr:hypothetical protein LTR36_010132 [Oleoguttula mirabilis]
MAEILGAVSSAVGIASSALELAESIKKFKNFCVRVAHAPKNLQRTLREIEVLSSLLTRLSSTLDLGTDITDSRSLQDCIELCRLGVKRITAVTESLGRKMSGKRRRTSIMFALSRDDLRDKMQELEQCKSSLLLAHQMYMQARAEDAARLQQQQKAALLAGRDGQSADTVHAPARTNTHRRASKRIGTRYGDAADSCLTVCTPAWLQQRIWVLSVSRGTDLWAWSLQIDLSAYRIIEKGSPAVEMCVQGNLVGLQQLFSKGEASPLDRLEGGGYFSRSDRSSAILVPPYKSIGFILAQPELFWFGRQTQAAFTAVDLDELRHELNLCRGFYDGDLDDEHDDGARGPTYEVQRFLKNSEGQAALTWHWSVLVQFATTLQASPTNFYWPPLLEHLDVTLPENNTSFCDARDGLQQLETLAVLYATCWHRDTDVRLRPRIQTLIVCIIKAGSSPLTRSVDGDNGTILQRFIGVVFCMIEDNGKTREQAYLVLDGALQQWVSILQQAGVDLLEYGALAAKHKSDYWDSTPYYRHGPEAPSILGLSNGPHPGDWHFWWQHHGDGYASEFWDMVDHPERTIPGAWDDE